MYIKNQKMIKNNGGKILCSTILKYLQHLCDHILKYAFLKF
jgi:hypothetical protein